MSNILLTKKKLISVVKLKIKTNKHMDKKNNKHFGGNVAQKFKISNF